MVSHTTLVLCMNLKATICNAGVWTYVFCQQFHLRNTRLLHVGLQNNERAWVSYFPSWHGNKRWGGKGECVLLLRASGWHLQTWIETESKEIRFFTPALQHSLQRPFETRSMHSGALSLRRSAQQFFWTKNKMEETSLSWPSLFAVSCRTPLPRLKQLNLLSKHLCFLPQSHIIFSNNHRIHQR